MEEGSDLGSARSSRAMTERTREAVFRGCAVLALAAAAFHAAAIASPGIARIEYDATYPAWRHLLFIVIDITVAWLLLRRPRWFVWAFLVLTLQVLSGHGRGAWHHWVEQREVDWISVGVSLAAPAILLLLIIDRRRNDGTR